MIVERATEDDLAGILAVDAAYMIPAGIALVEAAVKKRECYIARAGEDVIGFVILSRTFFEEYFIELLIVHPQHQQNHVDSALLRHVESIVPTEKLFTSTNESNQPLRAFLEGRGYVKSGWIENLDEGDPEIIYFKRL